MFIIKQPKLSSAGELWESVPQVMPPEGKRAGHLNSSCSRNWLSAAPRRPPFPGTPDLPGRLGREQLHWAEKVSTWNRMLAAGRRASVPRTRKERSKGCE